MPMHYWLVVRAADGVALLTQLILDGDPRSEGFEIPPHANSVLCDARVAHCYLPKLINCHRGAGLHGVFYGFIQQQGHAAIPVGVHAMLARNIIQASGVGLTGFLLMSFGLFARSTYSSSRREGEVIDRVGV